MHLRENTKYKLKIRKEESTMRVENVLDKIVAERLSRGWNEYELAKKADIAQSTISSWYSKHMLPSLMSLERIVDAFDMTLGQFFGESTMEVNSAEAELLRQFRRLPQKKKDALIELIKSS